VSTPQQHPSVSFRIRNGEFIKQSCNYPVEANREFDAKCNHDLRGIVRARRLSRATFANIRQNLFLVYNVASLRVAIGALYPLFGILISPIWASVA